MFVRLVVLELLEGFGDGVGFDVLAYWGIVRFFRFLLAGVIHVDVHVFHLAQGYFCYREFFRLGFSFFGVFFHLFLLFFLQSFLLFLLSLFLISLYLLFFFLL